MKNKSQCQFPWILPLIVSAMSAVVCMAESPYHLLKEIPVEGEGTVNCLTVDETAHRLYISQSQKILVLDLAKGQTVGEITNIPNARAFALAPRFKLGFSTDEQQSKLRTVDLRTLRIVNGTGVKTGKNPIAIVFEPSHAEIYTLNIGDNTISRYEADDGDFMGNIPLSGKPSAIVADPKNGQIICAIEDKGEVTTLDLKTYKVRNHWSIAPGENASAMAIDVEHQRLFIGCANGLLVIIDAVNGNTVTTLPIKSKVVSIVFDPITQSAAILNDQGDLNILHEDSKEAFTIVQTTETKKAIRAMAVDPTMHKIYLATGDEKQPGTILIYGTEPQGNP